MLERWFEIEKRGSSVSTEVMAGLTTFLAAAYIIAVHPSILATAGMPKGALITVTCLVAGLGTLLFALWPKVPFMMAPGMGLNAFFTYTLVLQHKLSWPTALGVVFLSGCLFLLLTALGIRERIIHAIPPSIRVATTVGIGLFIALIGLKNMGLVVDHKVTLVTHGALNKTVVVGLVGLLLIGVLEAWKVRGAMLWGILAVTGLAVPLGLTTLPDKLLATPQSIAPIAFQLNVMEAISPALWGTIFSFMFVDLFDSLGTLMGISSEAGMVQEDGTIDKMGSMLGADAIATVGGALLGTSTTTAYIESGAGIAQGGRTGFASVITGILFLLSMFLWPFIQMIPPCATAPALVIVGVAMLKHIEALNVRDIEEALPAFLTMALMPFTYSISHGIMFGFLSYVLLKLARGKFDELNPILITIAILSGVNLALV